MRLFKSIVAVLIGAVAGFLLHYLSACAGST